MMNLCYGDACLDVRKRFLFVYAVLSRTGQERMLFSDV